MGNSLVVQGLRLCPPNADGLGLSPDQGTRSYMPQRVHMLQLRPGTAKYIVQKNLMDIFKHTLLSRIYTASPFTHHLNHFNIFATLFSATPCPTFFLSF